MTAVSPDAITKLVIACAQRIANTLLPDKEVRFDANSGLFGGDAPFDSVTLVSFVVELEQALQDEYGKPVVLANERIMSRAVNPFSSVETLTEYVLELFAEHEQA